MRIDPIEKTLQSLDDAMTLGIAEGMVMTDFAVGQVTAYGMLVTAGTGSGRTVAEVAQGYVARAGQRA